MPARGAPTDQGGRGRPRHARVNELAGNIRQILHAHIKHQSAGAVRQRLPVVGRVRLGRILVSGDEAHGGRVGPVRQRNARIRRTGDAAGHPRHHLKLKSGRHQLFGLFPTPAEHVGIAALEASHYLASSGLGHDQGVYLRLR